MPEQREDLIEANLDWMDPGDRAAVLDSVACALHNKGYEIEGNTEDLDLEWLARSLWQAADRGRIGWHWEDDRLVPEVIREDWRNIAKVVLQVLPLYYGRIAARCVRYSEALRTMERAERVKSEAKRRHRASGGKGVAEVPSAE